ncbi:DUF4145 domain-containing protein [Nocardiopsis halophila]|uniref:DUF4145 domain-containing protein n=1 Tax=Nocardiopsis halophila TaxID=141692 RepID=UPI00036CC9C9|nr:DUF4145 domain-containing protein [Nocardiopsis halophila]
MTLRSDRRIHPDFQTSPSFLLGNAYIHEEAWQCHMCKRTILELVGWTYGENGPEECWRRTVWPDPVPRTLGSDVPERIRNLFVEAAHAERVPPYRLAGAGYRATIEEICKDQGATARTLMAKIDELKGRLPDKLIDDLHEVRMVGNDTLHQGIAYSADEIADVAEMIEEMALVLYVQPAERQRKAQARQQRRDEARKTP